MDDKFANQAADWDKPTKINMTTKFTQTLLEKLELNKHWRALEIGAGTGLVGLSLLEKVQSMVFVDTSKAMLAVLQNKIESSQIKDKVDILHAEIYEYQKQDIDFVFSCMAFHHIPDLEMLIAHLSKITTPNAIIVIGDIRLEDGSFHHFEPIPHKGFDTEELSIMFKNAGFEVQSIIDYNIINKETEPGVMNDFQQFMLFAKKQLVFAD